MAANQLFDTGIKVTGSFSAAGAFPVDGKYVVETIAERDDHVTQNRAYDGMQVYVKADKKTYQYQIDSTTGLGAWKDFCDEAVYAHAITNKGVATGVEQQDGQIIPGLYKIRTNSEGHVLEACPVTKEDLVALGVVGSDTIGGTALGLVKNGGNVTIGADGSMNAPIGEGDIGNFITKSVNDLENYYLKTETYTQAEVNELLSKIPKFNIQVVQDGVLPTQDISATTIYLVLNTDSESPNLYTEYIYINNAWEKIGTQTLDLTGYIKNTDLGSGLYMDSNKLSVQFASESMVAGRVSNFALAPNLIDEIVKVGLTANTKTLTDEEKKSAQSWLGVDDRLSFLESALGDIESILATI